MTHSRSGLRPAAFLLLMILVALNLRPALASLAPILTRIQQDLGLSALAIGALTTLPVLCLGLFAPLAPLLARRLGLERCLSAALLLLAIALTLRGLPPVPALFAGTLLAGAAIGIAGTLLPVLVKREIPGNADLLTGVYTMALCLGGALGAGLSVPLANGFGSWRLSIAAWAGVAVCALLAWRLGMPQPRPSRGGAAISGAATSGAAARPEHASGLARNALAWQVTLLMGCQSSLAYIVFGWLPALLQKRGVDEALAGWMLGVSVLCQIVAALAAPWIARLGRDQRPALWLLLLLTGTGLALALVGPQHLRWPAMILLGLGQGGSFSLALTLLVLRSATPAVAGQLSGMAQGVGYCIAALGPLSVGVLLEVQASLADICATLMVIVAAALLCATLAGRQRQLYRDEATGVMLTRHGRKMQAMDTKD